MTLTASETINKSAGNVYRAPLATGVPTDLDSLDAAWVHMGWLHEDGPELVNFEGEVTKFKGWNAQAPIRTTQKIGEPEITVPLLQWNQENLQLYFPGSTIESGTGNVEIPASLSPNTAQELLIVVEDGSTKIGLWFANTNPRAGDSISWPGDELSQIPVTFDVLSPSSGNLAEIIGVSAAA